MAEGPKLVEALSGALQGALEAALQPGEEAVIVVRGNVREAFAATASRILVLKEPVITGTAPVEVREAPLGSLTEIRAVPKPVGGRLVWNSAAPEAPVFIDYPTYDSSKYELVARRLQEMIGQPHASAPAPAGSSGAPEPAPAAVLCPKCQIALGPGACWCGRCGLQVFDPCWECGKPLVPGANFCGVCGTPNTEPAVVQCPQCSAAVGRGKVYCTACGSQARAACEECDQPMRREWEYCPDCGGSPIPVNEDDAVPVRSVRSAGTRTTEPALPPGLAAAPRAGSDPEAINARAVEAYERGDYQEAVRQFRQATEADPTNSGYWVNLGVAYGELDDDLQAFNAYNRAIEVNPREIQAFLNMGYLYMEGERTSEAREMWERVIRVAPDSEEAREARENLKTAEEV